MPAANRKRPNLDGIHRDIIVGGKQ
jgi:hypothetical protein